jgi:hypothetical protein
MRRAGQSRREDAMELDESAGRSVTAALSAHRLRKMRRSLV